MECPNTPQAIGNCAVMIEQYGFLAGVKLFDISQPGCPLVSLKTLTPGTTVRLEIEPEGCDVVTVEQGIVRWVQEYDVEVTITVMHAEEKEKIDALVRSSVQGDTSLFRWFWRVARGHMRRSLYLSFAPAWLEECATLSEAA